MTESIKDIIPKKVEGPASEQLSDAWHTWRKNFRSASTASTVFGVNPFESMEEMKKRELGLIPGVKFNKAMGLGVQREDEVRSKSEVYFDRIFTPECWEYGKYAASLDGIDEKKEIAVELKVSKYTFFQLKRGNLPANYKYQVLQQLMCSGAKAGYVVALNPDNGEIAVSQEIVLNDNFYDQLEEAWGNYNSLVVA
jgi:putative phage-type endonuclease